LKFDVACCAILPAISKTMLHMKSKTALFCVLAFMATQAMAQIDARLLQQPDASATHITFVYAGDVWTVPKSGGLAARLSSPTGVESFPKFSPDGQRIAYSANYHGHVDVCTGPTSGGIPCSLTHHSFGNRVIDWHPNVKQVLFATGSFYIFFYVFDIYKWFLSIFTQ
jgi:tricorn protease